MVTKLFACVVAGVLLVPAAALGKDGNRATPLHASEWKSAGALALPPIPYLETIPWLSTEATGPRLKVDQLLGPDLDTLKFALDKDATLTTRYSSMRREAGPAGRLESDMPRCTPLVAEPRQEVVELAGDRANRRSFARCP